MPDIASSPSAAWKTLALIAAQAGPVAAAVVGLFAGLCLRSVLLMAFVDRGRGLLITALRVLAAAAYGTLAVLLFQILRGSFPWDRRAVITGGLALLLASGPVLWLWARGRKPQRRSLTGLLLRAVLVLLALLCAAIVLMRAGFVALTNETPILTIEVTGETRPRGIIWAAPGEELVNRTLRTHHVIFKTPAGETVADDWVFGDQVAVKGRVLRLSPWLQLAGMQNLFELSFAHNGYLTAEREADNPHQTVKLPPRGPLAVHPRWRPLRDRLLAAWERKTPKDSEWAIRAATIESTYFALVDADGKPLRHTYQLVLTPGGLTGR
jgi:hypothetical protein